MRLSRQKAAAGPETDEVVPELDPPVRPTDLGIHPAGNRIGELLVRANLATPHQVAAAHKEACLEALRVARQESAASLAGGASDVGEDANSTDTGAATMRGLALTGKAPILRRSPMTPTTYRGLKRWPRHTYARATFPTRRCGAAAFSRSTLSIQPPDKPWRP